ncbi:MAG: dTDP-4-amino-4,6-dideoxygalactose transaminase [Bryobacteraceae bacterium]
MPVARIPFNRPVLTGREMEYMQEAIRLMHISGDGSFTKRVSALLEEALPAARVLLTTSCTHALEMAALLLDIKPGDEFILPSFTFVSAANAFVIRGARPVFADIRPDTLNIDASRVERLISPRTRAIVVLHYAGVACELDQLCEIARRYGIPVVEDNAHGLFGDYKGKHLGTFGALATQSFHETKNFTCGEGGALIINDSGYIERAEIVREKGTNRNQFFRGLVDKYSWVDVGSSYLPSDLLSGFLLAQLEARQHIQKRRQRIWEYYRTELDSWAKENSVRLPSIPSDCGQAFHLFYILLPSLADRQAMIAHLNAKGIAAVFHYLPLHLSKMGKAFGGQPGDCPVAERVSDRLLRLPFYNDLTEEQQASVVQELREFKGWTAREVGMVSQ